MTRVDAVKESWIATLNDETASVRKLEATLDHGILRREVLEGMEEAHDFPLQSVVRARVVTERVLEDLPLEVRGPGNGGGGTRRFLELAPVGYEEQTWELVGGPMIPCDRGLEAGAVVTAALELLDPDRYHISPPGFLAHLEDLDVEVPVEP